MTILRRLGTPLGGAVMLLVCWLPWAQVSCGDVHTEPDLWQLADQEAKLYVYPVLAAVLLIVGVLFMFRPVRGWSAAGAAAALLSALAWVYLLLERQDLAQQQMELQGLGGELGMLLQQVELKLGSGFILYLAGALVALFFSAWNMRAGPGRA